MKLLFRLFPHLPLNGATQPLRPPQTVVGSPGVQRHPLLALALFIAFSSTFLSIGSTRASDVTDCTEDALLTALGDGKATFLQDCSITLTAPITINSDSTIDAQGHRVIISGGSQMLIFEAQGAGLTMIGLTLSGGQNTNGGALYVNEGATVVLSNCTFTGNSAIGIDGLAGTDGVNSTNSNGGDGHPGASGDSALGGAIYNLGNLTLYNCVLATNSAAGGKGGSGGKGGNSARSIVGGNGAPGAAGMAGFGGAVYNVGTLILSNCVFTGNSATGGAGGSGGGGGNSGGNSGNGANGGTGAAGAGGAIYNLGQLSFTNCTFVTNTATGGDGGMGGTNGSGAFPGVPGTGVVGGTADGAGIYSTQNVVIVGSTFSANTARGGTSAAGGRLANGVGTTGPNGPDSSGGGIYANGGSVTNCTFFNNQAIGGAGGNGGNGRGNAGNGGNGGNATGGGLYNVGDIAVVNCTFSSCGAFGGTNGVAGTGAFPGSNGNRGKSRGGDIANGPGSFKLMNSIVATNLAGGNGFGTFIDGGHNLSSDASISNLSGKNVNPKIGPLADNGGSTKTMALLADSPAIDVIPSAGLPEIDQRGVFRPINVLGDIGAYEYELTGPPLIIQQPSDQNGVLSGSATLSVRAVGEPTLKYQWRLGSTEINGATRSSYTVTSLNSTKTGPYSVVITNGKGATNSTSAFVHLAPYIITQPTNQSGAVGQAATFTVVAGGDTNLTYRWRFNVTNDVSMATDSSVTVTNVQLTDAGAYDVVITNSFGSITSAAAMLNLAPVIVIPPSNQFAAIGGSASFSVVAGGTAPFNYQWRLNGSPLSGATGQRYSIGSVQTNHAGPYDVVVGNAFGTIDSAAATLTVISRPVITVQPASSISVTQRQSATFSVLVDGDSLTYQWRFNGSALPGATGTSYTVPSAQPSDAGTYTVLVTNQVGSVTSTPSLLRVFVPTTINQPQLFSNKFSFVYQTANTLTYIVQYKTNLDDPAWISLATNNGTGGSITNQDAITNSPSRFYRVLVR